MPPARADVAAADQSLVPLALLALGLAVGELQALRDSGFVASELRGRQTRVYQLRFRMDGRQRRRYLGTDVALATAVRRALDEWQSFRTTNLRLRAAAREAGRQLRAAKEKLAKPLARAGYHFHGKAIRRSRASPLELADRGRTNP